MCEYCGCQDVTVVDELTREHDAVVALIAEVRQHLADQRPEAAAAACRRMTQILAPHTTVEEQGLFPLLADDFPDHVAALTREHRRIETVLAEAADGVPGDPAWPDRLMSTLFELREHILREQDGVFPAALTSLDGQGWQQVEEVRRRAGSGLSPAASGAAEEGLWSRSRDIRTSLG